MKLILESNLDADDLLEEIYNVVNLFSEKRGKANPGIAVMEYDFEKISKLYRLYIKAVTDVLTIDIVERVCSKLNVKTIGGKGKIGAVAALGYAPDIDSTFELLVYGDPKVKQRLEIDFDYIMKIEAMYRPYTFSNIDIKRRHVLISPTGPDPVIIGVRGDSPIHIISLTCKILNLLNISIEGWLLYRTNQCTEIHISKSKNSRTFNPHRSTVTVLKCTRTSDRHLACSTDTWFNVFSYRHLGDITSRLEKCIGNIVEIWGGLRIKDEKYYMYIEGFRPISRRLVKTRNPTCPKCGHTLKSRGRGKGFQCPKCGTILQDVHKIIVQEDHNCNFNYTLPDLSEFRHLMKPIERIGIERMSYIFDDELIPLWIT